MAVIEYPLLDALHERVMRSLWAGRLTLLSRVLLAAAFIPSGLTKVLGDRFTTLGPSSPIGAFFEAMYQTGGYWRFLGAAQLIAALLLLVPRTAFFGAVLFLPIVVNIAVITTAIDFAGTVYITWMMVLAALWLLAWDWPRWRGVLATREGYRPVLAHASRAERVGWVLCVTAGVMLLLALRRVVPASWIIGLVGAGCVGAALVVIALARTSRESSR
jgi:hypothetical protein